jgi:integrase/recombinase XerD
MDFASFLREKQYLENVSANTLRWYRHALKWLPTENPDELALKDMVIRMREAGLKETGCNAAIRAINCYLRWRGSPHTVRQLKESTVVLPTFTTEQIKRLTCYKPRTAFQHRLHLLIMVLFDNGCRVSEALALRCADVDLDNLLVTVHGKGRKDRKVPMSFELRKALFKYRRGEGLLFTTANGTPWGRIGALRSIKLHCRKLGFEPPARTLHAMRHTFALNYLRKGGSVFHLQKILGHSTLEMTRRYANLLTEDLQAIHQRVSLLAV